MTNRNRSNAIFFFIIAGLGLATAWYFNAIAVMRGENYIADGFTSNVDWVYSLDLLIGGTAGMAFRRGAAGPFLAVCRTLAADG